MLVIGSFDYLTGYEISCSIFYAAPILLVAWLCDGKSALLIAILSGIIWWWADVLSGHTYPKTWIAIWEPSVRFSYFLLVSTLASSVRRQHDAIRSKVVLLEYSQRLEREIVQISEDERRRIGQDLHDGICQYLAGIGCAAASLKTSLLRSGMSAEAAAAEEIATLLTDSVVQTRDLARGLVPVQMDDAGLASALEELANSVSRLQRIDCQFVQETPAALPAAPVATHLYRIAQEAIANATRHGAARRVRVYLERAQLRIADNGKGLHTFSNHIDGMGLRIMEYRAHLIGGNLRVEQSDVGGAEVICTFDEHRKLEGYGHVA
jgi:signal transduction histidine kinase